MAYLRNCLLAVVLATELTLLLLVRMFVPAAVLPPVNLPNLIGLCGLVLLLDRACGGAPGGWIRSGLLAVPTFFLLIWASGLDLRAPGWEIALLGGVVFGVEAWLFDTCSARLQTGPHGSWALVVTVFGLFLAGQGFAGILL